MVRRYLKQDVQRKPIEEVTCSETLKKSNDPEAEACLANSKNITEACVARVE